jgi:hypothetical protein
LTTTISEDTISGFEEFSALTQLFLKGDAFSLGYVFRGQENASWKLDTSFHRAITNERRLPLPEVNRMLEIEQNLSRHFRAVASNLIPAGTLAGIREGEVIQWWPVMRHYGVPTRIMDWTASPYVAAYFAVSRLPDTDGVVYLVNHHLLNLAMKQSHDKLAELSLLASDYMNPDAPAVLNIFQVALALPDRMMAQQGCFMVCRNIAGNFEEVLASLSVLQEEKKAIALKRLRIPAALKAIFVKQLSSMNVTAQSLFPGLDGIGRYLDETTRWMFIERKLEKEKIAPPIPPPPR